MQSDIKQTKLFRLADLNVSRSCPAAAALRAGRVALPPGAVARRFVDSSVRRDEAHTPSAQRRFVHTEGRRSSVVRSPSAIRSMVVLNSAADEVVNRNERESKNSNFSLMSDCMGAV